MASEDDDTFLTVSEVAQLLKVNEQTVRNWTNTDYLTCIRVGRRVRIRRSDLDTLLDSCRTTSTSAGSVKLGLPIDSDAVTGEQFWDGQNPAPVIVNETNSDQADEEEAGSRT
jgi:excisionase family DNA binding protein